MDTESLDTYKMTTYLVEKCDEHHLPYYFKFDQYANRDDTIVIYSSTESLTKYVEILQEIKREHPELVSRVKKPPVLTGKIDGWIGYGSEPVKTPDGQRHSFNEIRAKVLENSIGKVTKQWIINHRNLQITYQGQNLSFQDYIAMKSTEKIINDCRGRYLSCEENDKKIAQRNGTIYNPSTVNDRLGYTLQDVTSLQFKQNIYNVLRGRIVGSLSKVCSGSYKDMDAVIMNVRNGKQIAFSGFDLETIIQQLSVRISKNDPNFIREVQTEIKNNSKQYGIDSGKFCFDIKAREKIRAITTQREGQKELVSQIGLRSEQQQTSKFERAKTIDINSLDVQTLSERINPVLMKRKIESTKGTEIHAKQYIEEESLWKKKYNDDINQMLYNTTRNNAGVINPDSQKSQNDLMEMIKQTSDLNGQHGNSQRRL